MNKNVFFMEMIANIQDLPALREDVIHIWGVYLPDIEGQLSALGRLLAEKEQVKASRFLRESDRKSSIAARGALRVLLSGYTGMDAAAIQFSYSENGKPSLGSEVADRSAVSQAARLPGGSAGSRRMADDSIAFNVSHSADWVVLAFGRNRKIGVDVEKIKWDMDVAGITARYFAPEEIRFIEAAEDKHAAFFQLWARKEAYVKACGSGLFQGFNRFSVPLNGNELPDQAVRDGWLYQRLEAGSKYAAAVVTDQAVAETPCYDFGGLKWDS